MVKSKQKRKQRRKKLMASLLACTMAVASGVALPQTAQAAEGDIGSTELQNPRVEMNTRDTVYFGRYWQEDTNGDGVADQNDEMQPIRWRIISRDGDDAFVIADKILDCQPYNDIDTDVTWENCTLRSWLNEDFYNMAFTPEEQNAIIEQSLINENNPDYGTEGGNDTKDKVYSPCIKDMNNPNYGFYVYDWGDQEGIGKVTSYAVKQGVYTDSYEGGSYWWLRSPGDRTWRASYVSYGGCMFMDCEVGNKRVGVRPALHINLSFPFVQQGEKIETSLKSTIWDTVELGSYKGTPIVWRVIQVKGNEVFLLADRSLEEKKYNEDSASVTWENCTLREWLNEEFYQKSFDREEKEGIVKKSYLNKDHPWYGTDGGNDALDYVTILSMEDMVRKEYGFPTEYECSDWGRTAWTIDAETSGYDNSSWYWLRTPGYTGGYAVIMHTDGFVGGIGNYVNYYGGGVRPAMHFDLSVYPLKKTGTVMATKDGVIYQNTTSTPEPEPSKQDVSEVFDDIKKTDWWYPYVQYAYDNSIMAGMGASFKPNGKLTREQFVQVLYSNSGKPKANIENGFSDVKNDWYTDAVLWANEKGVAAGKGNGIFGVGQEITRQELATMLYKYASLNDYDLTAETNVSERFVDSAEISDWAKTALDWAVTQEIMSGKGGVGDSSTYKLDPRGTATRAECATMMMKLLTK